jgi:hypothetical protein
VAATPEIDGAEDLTGWETLLVYSAARRVTSRAAARL